MSIRNWCLCGVFAAAFFVTFTAAAARTVYTYADGSEVEIAHAETVTNSTDGVLCLGENSVIRLTAADAGTGLFDFKPVVHCTNGQARITVDATAAAQAGFTGIRWYNHVRAKGGITVKGLDKIVFGTASKVHGGTTDANTYLDAAITFVDADGNPVASPAGITVTNAAVLGVAQTCPLVPAAGAWIWPHGANSYGTPGETLDITGYNLGIISVNGIAADAVKVPAGSQLAARPCNILYDDKTGPAYFYKWGGSEETVAKNVVLDGGSFYIKSTPNYTHTGAITGNGSLLFEGGKAGTFTAPNFTGAITNNGNRLVFGGDITAPVDIKAGNSDVPVRTLAFQPADYLSGSTVTTGPITGNDFDTSAVEVQVKQTLTIASVANRLAFTHAGANAVAVVNKIISNAILSVEDGMELHILSQDMENKVVPRNTKGSGNWTISGPATGERVNVLLAQVPANAKLAFGGNIHVTGIPADVAEITILDGADVTGDIPDTCPVTSQGGKWQYKDWHDKIALWCDASAADSFVYAQDVNADLTIGESKIFWWNDRRPEQRTYSFVMSRFKPTATADIEKYAAMYPSVVSSGDELGGKSYLKCSYTSQTRMGMLDPDTTINGQNSNDKFTYIPSQYAIVVARNISNNAGSAILCSKEGLLAASKMGYDANIFTNENLKVYRDGVELEDPTSTTWGNSEWHIYSFTTDNASINGLVCADDPGNNKAGGGFDYAEIMIFNEMPSENERIMAEEYLSAKWGLDIVHSETTAEDIFLSGYGETTLAKPSRLAGSFGGTIDLGGKTLELGAGEKPITADQIPEENRTLWIDPMLGESMMMSDEPGKADEVAAAFSRDAAGLDAAARYYLQSAYDPTGVTNRRPRLVTSRSGGVANKWFDFFDGYGDGLGNNLMICTMPWHEPNPNYAYLGTPPGLPNWYSIDYKTIFMVIDSSRGGGSPFLHYAGGGDTGNRGNNPTMDTPIFNGCSDMFTNATVYLDGVAVTPNPAQAGFSGKCEVFTTVLPTNADSKKTTVKAFGFCNISKGYYNQEKIGEIIMFNDWLDDATRKSIEAYLMKKWLGKMPEGYSDFSDLTVTGSGTLKVSSIADLPQLGADFTGDVTISTNRLAFTFAEGATVARKAVSAANTAFTLPSAVTVDISFAARPEAGRYTLFTADVANDVAWIRGALVNAKAKNVRLVWDAEAKTLYAEVRPSGTAIILR